MGGLAAPDGLGGGGDDFHARLARELHLLDIKAVHPAPLSLPRPSPPLRPGNFDHFSDFRVIGSRTTGEMAATLETLHTQVHTRPPSPHPSVHAARGCLPLARVAVSGMFRICPFCLSKTPQGPSRILKLPASPTERATLDPQEVLSVAWSVDDNLLASSVPPPLSLLRPFPKTRTSSAFALATSHLAAPDAPTPHRRATRACCTSSTCGVATSRSPPRG